MGKFQCHSSCVGAHKLISHFGCGCVGVYVCAVCLFVCGCVVCVLCVCGCGCVVCACVDRAQVYRQVPTENTVFCKDVFFRPQREQERRSPPHIQTERKRENKKRMKREREENGLRSAPCWSPLCEWQTANSCHVLLCIHTGKTQATVHFLNTFPCLVRRHL